MLRPLKTARHRAISPRRLLCAEFGEGSAVPDAGRAADVTALRILGPGFEPAVVDAIDILRS